MSCIGLTACVFTAACGGSGGANVLSFAEMQQKNIDVLNILRTTPGVVDMTGTDLPETGDAKFAGVMVFTASPTLTLAGITVLSSDFAAERIHGSALAFRDQNETAYNGTLVIAESDIDVGNANQADPTFSTGITGTLTSDATTIGVVGNLEGDFYGTDENPTFVRGTISGTANVNGVVNTLTDAGFIAERSEGY